MRYLKSTRLICNLAVKLNSILNKKVILFGCFGGELFWLV
jgi:hypothetical protein